MPPKTKRPDKETPASAPPAKSSRRALQKRDTDEQVDRIVKTHFAGWDSSSTDVVQRDGKCLRETLADERRRSASSGGRVSTRFIATQKEKFKPENAEEQNAMEVPVDCPEARPQLLQAIAQAISHNPWTRSKAAVMSLLQTDMKLNLREAVGLVRAVAGLSPFTSGETRAFILAVLSFFYRTDQAQVFRKQLVTQKSLWDNTLCATLAWHRKQNLGWRSFIDLHHHLFDVLDERLPHDALAIVSAGQDRRGVRVEILRAHASSSLGEQLFGDAHSEVVILDFGSVCHAKFADMEKDDAGESLIKDAQVQLPNAPRLGTPFLHFVVTSPSESLPATIQISKAPKQTPPKKKGMDEHFTSLLNTNPGGCPFRPC